MTNSKSFQIIFNKADGQTYSATFDKVIPLDCKGKFADVKGFIYNMDKWTRTTHSQSTLINIIHNAIPSVMDYSDCDSLCCNQNCYNMLKQLDTADSKLSQACNSLLDSSGVCLNALESYVGGKSENGKSHFTNYKNIATASISTNMSSEPQVFVMKTKEILFITDGLSGSIYNVN